MTPDQLLTRDQAEIVFRSWGCDEPLPKPSQQVLINFPPAYEVRLIRVTRSPHKSTYGKPLFRVQFDPPEFTAAALGNGG